MKCLMKYQWVKLPRNHLPEGKGVMGAWAKLAARAAFRRGQASYCGHINAVRPGMWSGGVVGLKSILGVKSRTQALETLDKLSELGYLKYKLDKRRLIGIILAAVIGLLALLYLGGVLSQVFTNNSVWMSTGGLTGQAMMKPVNMNPLVCIPLAFTGNGLKGILGIAVISGIIYLMYRLYNRFDGKQRDPRGFTKSDSGIYGTANWMDEKEMQEVLEISPVGSAEGTILGEYKGKAVCMPKDTRLNSE